MKLRKSMNERQEAKLAKLLAAKDDLNKEQAAKLKKLQKKKKRSVAEPSADTPALVEEKRRRKASSSTAPAKAAAGSSDLTLTCAGCSETFTFSVDDQAWYASAGWYEPKNCTVCAAKKKDRFHAKEEKQKRGTSGEGRCFNCGASGHFSSHCPKPKGGANNCYTCGSSDHLSRNCPMAAKTSKAKVCFKCGSTDHLSKDCTLPSICFNCGEEIGSESHPLRACTRPKRTEGPCYLFRHGRCDRKKCRFEHEVEEAYPTESRTRQSQITPPPGCGVC